MPIWGSHPFEYTDPSGHSSWKKWARIAASVAISIYTGGSAGGAKWGLFGGSVSTGTAMTTVAIGGALSSAVATGSWDGAYWGAFTGQAFFAAGQWLASSDWARGSFAGDLSGAGLAAKTVSHGLIGGTAAHLQGGKFGHGFISSGASAAITPYASDSSRFGGNPFAQGTVIALVGGSVSSLTGGKFANGAVTAAMAFAFNDQLSSECDEVCELRRTREEFMQGSHENAADAAYAIGEGGKEIYVGAVTGGPVGGILKRLFGRLFTGGRSASRATRGEVSLPGDQSQVRHIFRDAPGHLPDTPANRQLLLNVASDSSSRVGVDRFGNVWSAATRSDGTQVWVSTRNGVIQNGGLNRTPEAFQNLTRP